jgi:hypothetical protein
VASHIDGLSWKRLWGDVWGFDLTGLEGYAAMNSRGG